MDRLKNLQHNLEKLNLEAEAKQIGLLKLSLMGPTPERVTEMKKGITPEQAQEIWHIILDMLGIIPGAGEVADLANAALYLSESVNIKSLFNAGVSIVSMVSGLGDSAKIFKYITKAYQASDLKALAPIAQKIINNQGQIKAVFTRLKSTEVKKRIAALPHGDLLVKYSDQMYDVVISWAKNLVLETTEKGLEALIREDE